MSMYSGPVGAASGDADSFAGTGTATASPPAGATLPRGEIGLLGVLMPGLAQVAPAFNLFFTTGLMAAFAGASVPLVFLISVVGLGSSRPRSPIRARPWACSARTGFSAWCSCT